MEGLDSHYLRQFLVARDAGDDTAARGWWDKLLEANFDRITNMVKAKHSRRLKPHEIDEAIQLVSIEILNNLIRGFRGRSMGEWVNAVNKVTEFRGKDAQSNAIRHSKHETGLYVTNHEGEEQLHRAADKASASQHEELEQNQEDVEALDADRSFLDSAVLKLTKREREVIELDRQGVPTDEICEQLGASRDVVYAARSRALKHLRKLRSEYEAGGETHE